MGVKSKEEMEASIAETLQHDSDKDALTCSCCGNSYLKHNKFIFSNSPLYVARHSRTAVCVDCAEKIFVDLLNENPEEPAKALKRVCEMLDVYYDDSIVNQLGNLQYKENMFARYFLEYHANRDTYSKTYADNVKEDEAKLIQYQQVVANSQQHLDNGITPAMFARWGGSAKQEDFVKLEAKYTEWVQRYEVNDLAQEKIICQLCLIELLEDEALIEGNMKTYTTLLQQYQSLMNNGNLTPKSSKNSISTDDQMTFGKWIEHWESHDPIDENPYPEWADVDGIGKLISIFVGGLGDMLGIKNAHVDAFKKFIEPFTAKPIVTENEDDYEDMEKIISAANSDYIASDEYSVLEGMKDENNDSDDN